MIDFHLHLLKKPGYAEEMLKAMDAAGVEKGVLHGLMASDTRYKDAGLGTNEDVLKVIRQYPDRFVGSVYLDPRDKNCRDVLDEYVSYGFRCVKMVPTLGYYPDEDEFASVYERINELALPILFHAGITNGLCYNTAERKYYHSKYSRPIYLDGLLRKYSRINFIIAHVGHPYYVESIALAISNANVYLDISGWGGLLRFFMKRLDILSFFDANNNPYLDYSRVIWGTDNDQLSESLAGWKEFLGVSGENERMIFGGTAARILYL